MEREQHLKERVPSPKNREKKRETMQVKSQQAARRGSPLSWWSCTAKRGWTHTAGRPLGKYWPEKLLNPSTLPCKKKKNKNEEADTRTQRLKRPAGDLQLGKSGGGTPTTSRVVLGNKKEQSPSKF